MALSTVDIYNYLKHFQKKTIFKGVFACDDLPSNITLPAAFVVNLSGKNERGSHWISIYIDKLGTGYYFDSFALPINNRFISYFLKMHTKNVVINKTQLQHVTSNKCGKYCCIFIISKLYEDEHQFLLKRFSKNLKLNDIVVDHLYNYLKSRITI